MSTVHCNTVRRRRASKSRDGILESWVRLEGAAAEEVVELLHLLPAKRP